MNLQEFPYIEAEVRYAVKEYAATAVDVIARRLRLVLTCDLVIEPILNMFLFFYFCAVFFTIIYLPIYIFQTSLFEQPSSSRVPSTYY